MINHDAWQRTPDPVPTSVQYFFPSLEKFEYGSEEDFEIKKILEELGNIATRNNLEIWYHYSKLEDPQELLDFGLNTLGNNLMSTARLFSPSERMSQRIFKFKAIHPNVPIDKASSLVILLIPRRTDRTDTDWYLGGNLDDDKSQEFLEKRNGHKYGLPPKFIFGFIKRGSVKLVRNQRFLL